MDNIEERTGGGGTRRRPKLGSLMAIGILLWMVSITHAGTALSGDKILNATVQRIRRKLAEDGKNFDNEEFEQNIDQSFPGVFGRAGIDYPVLGAIPQTDFHCKYYEKLTNSKTGYYADMQTSCQVFHVCDSGRKTSYLCPNGTVFRQSHLICDWWFRVNCEKSLEQYTTSAQSLSKKPTSNDDLPPPFNSETDAASKLNTLAPSTNILDDYQFTESNFAKSQVATTASFNDAYGSRDFNNPAPFSRSQNAYSSQNIEQLTPSRSVPNNLDNFSLKTGTEEAYSKQNFEQSVPYLSDAQVQNAYNKKKLKNSAAASYVPSNAVSTQNFENIGLHSNVPDVYGAKQQFLNNNTTVSGTDTPKFYAQSINNLQEKNQYLSNIDNIDLNLVKSPTGFKSSSFGNVRAGSVDSRNQFPSSSPRYPSTNIQSNNFSPDYLPPNFPNDENIKSNSIESQNQYTSSGKPEIPSENNFQINISDSKDSKSQTQYPSTNYVSSNSNFANTHLFDTSNTQYPTTHSIESHTQHQIRDSSQDLNSPTNYFNPTDKTLSNYVETGTRYPSTNYESNSVNSQTQFPSTNFESNVANSQTLFPSTNYEANVANSQTQSPSTNSNAVNFQTRFPSTNYEPNGVDSQTQFPSTNYESNAVNSQTQFPSTNYESNSPTPFPSTNFESNGVDSHTQFPLTNNFVSNELEPQTQFPSTNYESNGATSQTQFPIEIGTKHQYTQVEPETHFPYSSDYTSQPTLDDSSHSQEQQILSETASFVGNDHKYDYYNHKNHEKVGSTTPNHNDYTRDEYDSIYLTTEINAEKPAVSDLLLLNDVENKFANVSQFSLSENLLTNSTKIAFENLFQNKSMEPDMTDLNTEFSNGLLTPNDDGQRNKAPEIYSADQQLPPANTSREELRELAQVFSRALSAFLENPAEFRKVLAEVRPTEPPTPSLIDKAEELLDFAEADLKHPSTISSRQIHSSKYTQDTTEQYWETPKPEYTRNEYSKTRKQVRLCHTITDLCMSLTKPDETPPQREEQFETSETRSFFDGNSANTTPSMENQNLPKNTKASPSRDNKLILLLVREGKEGRPVSKNKIAQSLVKPASRNFKRGLPKNETLNVQSEFSSSERRESQKNKFNNGRNLFKNVTKVLESKVDQTGRENKKVRNGQNTNTNERRKDTVLGSQNSTGKELKIKDTERNTTKNEQKIYPNNEGKITSSAVKLDKSTMEVQPEKYERIARQNKRSEVKNERDITKPKTPQVSENRWNTANEREQKVTRNEREQKVTRNERRVKKNERSFVRQGATKNIDRSRREQELKSKDQILGISSTTENFEIPAAADDRAVNLLKSLYSIATS